MPPLTKSDRTFSSTSHRLSLSTAYNPSPICRTQSIAGNLAPAVKSLRFRNRISSRCVQIQIEISPHLQTPDSVPMYSPAGSLQTASISVHPPRLDHQHTADQEINLRKRRRQSRRRSIIPKLVLSRQCCQILPFHDQHPRISQSLSGIRTLS